MEIAAQVFGILAFIVSVVSFQLKTYRQILWVQTLCTVFTPRSRPLPADRDL